MFAFKTEIKIQLIIQLLLMMEIHLTLIRILGRHVLELLFSRSPQKGLDGVLDSKVVLGGASGLARGGSGG